MKLTLFLTEHCNRKCKYCDIGNLKIRHHIDEKLLKKYLPYLSERFDFFVLTGGECGLLPENILEYIFKTLDGKKIQVNTNGKFIDKYHWTYRDKIDSYMYHPVSEINSSFIPLDIKNIKYHFPVHKQNIELLGKFLDKHKTILFEVSPYDDKMDQDQFRMELNDFIKIEQIIRFRNVTTYTKELFNRIIKTWNVRNAYRDFCQETLQDYSIDFVNGKIKNCVCSHSRSSKVDLTFNNIDKMKDNDLDFEETFLCDDCFHYINLIKNLGALDEK